MPFVWGIFVLMLVLVFHVDETVGKCELMPEQYKGGNSYDCSNSGLESFPSRLFAKNTTSIDFSRNALTVLAWNEFENLTNLTYLDVSQNMISNVAKDAFLNLQLETLLFGANIMACDLVWPKSGNFAFTEDPRNLINCFNCTVQSQTLKSNHTDVALTECGDHQYYECRYDLYPVYCNDTFCANGGELKVGRICECNYFYTGIYCDDFDTSKTWFIVFMLLLGCCYYGPETCKICGKCECSGCEKCLIGCLGVLVAIVLFPKRMIGKARGSIKAGQQRRRSDREAREAFVKQSAQFSEATPLQIQTLGGDMYSVVNWGLVRSIVDELKKQHPDTFGEEIVTLMYDGNFNKPDVDETELVPFVDAPFNLKLIKCGCDLKAQPLCRKCALIARRVMRIGGDWGDRCITGGGDRGDLIDRKIPTSMIALFGVQVQVQDQDQDLIQPPPPSYASREFEFGF